VDTKSALPRLITNAPANFSKRAFRETKLGFVDETIYCHHLTKESAEVHARYLREHGFESKIEPDGKRWLMTARRDDQSDDAYTVTRSEAF